MTLLNVGDVFTLKGNMRFFGKIPEKFVYLNREDSKSTTVICMQLDQVFYCGGSKAVFSVEYNFAGDYVVTDAKMTGGGTGHGPGDIYPDGWFIEATRLLDDTYYPSAQQISFYQSGAFIALNPNVQVLKRMRKIVKFVND